MQEENTRADIPPYIKRFYHSDMKVFDCRGANNMSRSRALVSAPRCRLIGVCVGQARTTGGRVEPEHQQGFFAYVTDLKGMYVEW